MPKNTTTAVYLTTPVPVIARDVADAQKKAKFAFESATSDVAMVTSKVCRYDTRVVDTAGSTSWKLAAAMPCSKTKQFANTVVGRFEKATAIFPSPWKDIDYIHSKTQLDARNIGADRDSNVCTMFGECGDSSTTFLPKETGSPFSTAGAESLATAIPMVAHKEISPSARPKKCKWTQTLDYATTTMVMKTKVPCSMTSAWVSWSVPKTIHIATVAPVTSQPVVAQTTPAPRLVRDTTDANKKKNKCKWAQTLDYDNTKLTYNHEIPCTMFTSWTNLPMPSSVHAVPPPTITSWTTVVSPAGPTRTELVFQSVVTSTFDVVLTPTDTGRVLKHRSAATAVMTHCDATSATASTSVSGSANMPRAAASSLTVEQMSDELVSDFPDTNHRVADRDLKDDDVPTTDPGKLVVSWIGKLLDLMRGGFRDQREPTNGDQDDSAKLDVKDAQRRTTRRSAVVARSPQNTPVPGSAPPKVSISDRKDLVIAFSVPFGFVVFMCLIRKFCITRSHEDMAHAEDISGKAHLGDGQPISNANLGRDAGIVAGTMAGSVA